MKLLQVAHEFAAVIGIHPFQTYTKNRFNVRNFCVFLLLILFTISTSALVLFGARTGREFEEAFFAWISASFTNIGLLINILKSRDIFRLVDHFENTVETRKFPKFFNIEKKN